MATTKAGIRNAALNRYLEVTSHAVRRWEERGDGTVLEEAIARAVPFGAQFGVSQLLIDGDYVFPVVASRVVTTLTRQQALANMQMFGLSANIDVFLPPGPAAPARIREATSIPATVVSRFGKIGAVDLVKALSKKERDASFAELADDRCGIEWALYQCAVESAQQVVQMMFSAVMAGDR